MYADAGLAVCAIDGMQSGVWVRVTSHATLYVAPYVAPYATLYVTPYVTLYVATYATPYVA